MAGFEVAVLLLVLPFIAWAVGASVVWFSFSDLRVRGLRTPSRGSSEGRVLVALTLTATKIIFGLVLWFLVTSLESRFRPLGVAENHVLLWMGIGFSWAVLVAVFSATWTARWRIGQLAGDEFGRVLPLLAVWNALVIFSLIVNFLLLGRVSGVLDEAGGLTASQASQLISVAQVSAMSTLGAPIAAVLSAAVGDISSPRLFMSAVVRTEIGTVPPILGLVWAFLQLGGL